MTTYAPAYTYISNKNYAMLINNTEIGYIDFSKDDQTNVLLWHSTSM